MPDSSKVLLASVLSRSAYSGYFTFLEILPLTILTISMKSVPVSTVTPKGSPTPVRDLMTGVNVILNLSAPGEL